MNWINKLERKIGKYAIPNLMLYIIILYVAGFAIHLVSPELYTNVLSLDAAAILRGQVWRIFTFIVQPPSYDILGMVISLYLYYMIGQSLEAAWGSFRFNMYFFSGMFFHVIAAIVAYLITGVSLPLGTSYINLSLFFAFAVLNPNMQLLVFYLIPVKIKWLALIDGLYFGYTILQAFLPQYGGSPYYGAIYKANALAAAVSLLNFLLFYLSSKDMKSFSAKEIKRKNHFKREIRHAKIQHQNQYADGVHHRCTTCGITDKDDPSMEFRYCSRCNGNHEYCKEHLFTHEHVK